MYDRRNLLTEKEINQADYRLKSSVLDNSLPYTRKKDTKFK